MDFDKIVVVTRPTRLEDSIRRFNTKSQVQFYIESRGQSFDDYELEDDNYQRSRDLILQSIDPGINTQIIDRSFLPNFIFGPRDLVLVIGQDGLVVNTAKYLDGQSILAVNPDPDRFDGVLLPFLVDHVKKAVHDLEDDQLITRKITMARVDLNDGQSMFAFNDFFIGASSHISARYTISALDRTERHSSSGIIVSTPAGSTGWLSSLYNMSAGIVRFRGQKNQVIDKKTDNRKKSQPHPSKTEDQGRPNQIEKSQQSNPAEQNKQKNKLKQNQYHLSEQAIPWESKKLIFVVREPFRSKWSAADLVAGEIQDKNNLVIESHMAGKGVIFSDGIENDYLEFNSGATATISIAQKTTNLLSYPLSK